jgi:trehalose 6-phosphate synthase
LARLVIVSNRVSPLASRRVNAGGLAVALREALRQSGGMWFGCSDRLASAAGAPPEKHVDGKVAYVTVPLTREEHELYYLEFSNASLWPLFHFRLGLVEYHRAAYDGYREVNARLAQLLKPLLREDDDIWVHDFHLIPMGQELRKLGVRNCIGFFLHTPFPPPEALAVLPHHQDLIEALCAYELVGFQTEEGVQAFHGAVVDVVGGKDLGDGAFEAFGRTVTARAFPVGIDAAGFAAAAEKAVHSPEAQRLKESLADRSLILGVDRLDYSKGIPNRFEAIESLLAQWPEYRRKISYLQIAPHSRGELTQYRALRREIEGAAGRVNGKFAEFDWAPIRYVNKAFSRPVLAGFCRLAQIGLVTPMRDGMNLVAKEYVAAQDPRQPGVLVLSRFAGAAHELTTALLVNPFDVDEIAAAIHRGLEMPVNERRERWKAMMDTVSRNTVVTWWESFLAALRGTSHAVLVRERAS